MNKAQAKDIVEYLIQLYAEQNGVEIITKEKATQQVVLTKNILCEYLNKVFTKSQKGERQWKINTY